MINWNIARVQNCPDITILNSHNTKALLFDPYTYIDLDIYYLQSVWLGSIFGPQPAIIITHAPLQGPTGFALSANRTIFFNAIFLFFFQLSHIHVVNLATVILILLEVEIWPSLLVKLPPVLVCAWSRWTKSNANHFGGTMIWERANGIRNKFMDPNHFQITPNWMHYLGGPSNTTLRILSVNFINLRIGSLFRLPRVPIS